MFFHSSLLYWSSWLIACSICIRNYLYSFCFTDCLYFYKLLTITFRHLNLKHESIYVFFILSKTYSFPAPSDRVTAEEEISFRLFIFFIVYKYLRVDFILSIFYWILLILSCFEDTFNSFSLSFALKCTTFCKETSVSDSNISIFWRMTFDF